MSIIAVSFVSIPQGTTLRTSGGGTEYQKAKHYSQESVTMDTVDQSSAYAEIAPEVRYSVQHACQNIDS